MTIAQAATPAISATTAPVFDAAANQLEQQVMRKVSRHVLRFLFLLFVFSFLDRVNIGFASLTMMQDLGLSGTRFGFITTLFYTASIACSIRHRLCAVAPECARERNVCRRSVAGYGHAGISAGAAAQRRAKSGVY
ncbi:hypothetical protein [Janthinobacterium sp. LB3P118]|uniref:hypothetical protein n=1 Tax=Janthinobacterium sp. LB3P118 TaxID=3424195 RepID=UPI003F238D29